MIHSTSNAFKSMFPHISLSFRLLQVLWALEHHLSYVVSLTLVYMELKGLAQGFSEQSLVPYLTDTTEPTPTSNLHLSTKPFTGGSPKRTLFPSSRSLGHSEDQSTGRWEEIHTGKALCVIKYFRQETSCTEKFNKSKSCLFRKELTDQQRIWFLPGKAPFLFLSSSFSS